MTEDTLCGITASNAVPLRTQPTQTEVLDQLLALAENGPIDDLDVDVWGASMAIAQGDEQDPVGTRETAAAFERWATEHDCTLRPAFEWRSAELEGETEERRGRIVTPLTTRAVYVGEDLRAVYPHVDDETVNTIHDGVDAIASTAETRDASHPEDEDRERRTVPTR